MLNKISDLLIRRREAPFYRATHHQACLLIDKIADEQKSSAGIDSYLDEARVIATSCDMFKFGRNGINNHDMFVLLGLIMLKYEPELGHAILDQLDKLKKEVGYKPKMKLIATLRHIEFIEHTPTIPRTLPLKVRKELKRLYSDNDYRCLKAGQLLAIGILSDASSVIQASKIYHSDEFGPLVKLSLDRILKYWNPVIAAKIIN